MPLKRGAQRCSHAHGLRIVGEQIHVVGGVVDESVRDHRGSAGEGECAGFGEARGRSRDEVLERVERHGSGRGTSGVDQWVATLCAPMAAETSGQADAGGQRTV